MLFTKDLKALGDDADKGSVTTLAHSMMNAARSADSGLAGPGELDRYPYAEVPGPERSAASWEGGDSDLGRA
ncbi:GntR family transcriptional regulator, partial [Streptomyces sp. NRRL WC-3753]